MTPQKKLADKLYELIPHKKELNFGCERDVVLYGTQEKRDKGFISTEYYGQVHKDDIEEIIGQPLRLADLLMAITMSKPDSEEEGIKLENNIIQIVRGSFGVKGYNFSKDNILDQSDEFCEWVYDLLTKK